MPLLLRTFIFTLFTFTLFSGVSYAGPVIKLCIEDNCKKPVHITITDTCWAEVKDIFSTPFQTDKDEQDNMVNAIALMEYDSYQSLAKQLEGKSSASDLYTENSNKNDYRNIRNYIAILMDNYLVTRHLLRKTIKQNSWAVFQGDVLLLQSLTNSKLYILESNNSELGSSSVIKDYLKKEGFSLPTSSSNTNFNSLDEDDFE